MHHPRLALPTLLWLIVLVAAIPGGWWLIEQTNQRSSSESAKTETVHLSERLKGRDLRESLRERFSGSRPIRLLSWNGRWIGTDVDAEIELRTVGTARLTEYGEGISYYDGTYSINNDSELTLRLKGYPGHWPTMRVHRDDSTLLLAPTERLTAATSLRTSDGSFWPFREITR